MSAQQNPQNIKIILMVNIFFVSAIRKKPAAKPIIPEIIVFFLPNLVPISPAGYANIKNDSDINVNEVTAAPTLIPRYFSPYNVKKASIP